MAMAQPPQAHTIDPSAATDRLADDAHGESRRPGRPHKDDESDVSERLLDAATELAVEVGFEACGLREIARRAGVSPGMIAYYFGDRDGLYQAMFQRIFARMHERVFEVLEDSSVTSEDRIAALIRIQVSTIAADPWLPRLVMREVLARQDAGLHGIVKEQVAKGPIARMVEWLEEEQARHGIRTDLDPRLLAMTIAGLAGFPYLMAPIVGEEIGLDFDADFAERLIEHNQRILTAGLRPRAPVELESETPPDPERARSEDRAR